MNDEIMFNTILVIIAVIGIIIDFRSQMKGD